MPQYHFDLAGDWPAHDVAGHQCGNDREARRDGDLLAYRLVVEKPGMARGGNFIVVRNERGEEIHRAPLAMN
jgi:hypothetical protein